MSDTATPLVSEPSTEPTDDDLSEARRIIQRGRLEIVHKAVLKWFGTHYDLDVVNAVLATTAANNTPGDPPWLLIIGGSGDTKTESLSIINDVPGVHVVSKINSDASFLSGTSTKEKAADADGGLLRKIGSKGILVLKDFTTTLGLSREVRSGVLDALREIHDGRYVRSLAVDGGRTLEWKGRIVCIAACTTSWDRAYEVSADLGPRFVVIRNRSKDDAGTTAEYRRLQGMRAMLNSGHEEEMRNELWKAVALLMSDVPVVAPKKLDYMTDDEMAGLLAATDIATRCRTAVDKDFQGNPESAHALEANTRFPKQLYQMFRGALLIGLDREEAMSLVIRCAADSIPPQRLRIIRDVFASGPSGVTAISKRLGATDKTVGRECASLVMLGAFSESRRVDTTGRPAKIYSIHPNVAFDIFSLFSGRKCNDFTEVDPFGKSCQNYPPLPHKGKSEEGGGFSDIPSENSQVTESGSASAINPYDLPFSDDACEADLIAAQERFFNKAREEGWLESWQQGYWDEPEAELEEEDESNAE